MAPAGTFAERGPEMKTAERQLGSFSIFKPKKKPGAFSVRWKEQKDWPGAGWDLKEVLTYTAGLCARRDGILTLVAL